MSKVQLQVFSPGAELAIAQRESVAQKVAEAYRDGHSKGFAQGAEASAREHADAQDQLRSQFIEALQDGQASHQEAQARVIQSLGPLLGAMVDVLAPRLAEAGLKAEISAELETLMRTRPDVAPVLVCAPELAVGLKNVLEARGTPFHLREDPGMTPLEARIGWDDGFDTFDMSACLEAMKAKIDAYLAAALPETAKKETRDVG